MFRFRVVSTRLESGGGGATTIIIDAAGLHGGPWQVGYRCERCGSWLVAIGAERLAVCRVPTSVIIRARADIQFRRRRCRCRVPLAVVKSPYGRFGAFEIRSVGRVGRRGNGAAAAAAVVVVTRVHLLCRHRSRLPSLLVIMRRRCSIVVAATTATESAGRTMNTTTTDSWSIRHRRRRLLFRGRKNTCSIILFSSSICERDRTHPHTVPANASPPPPPERSQHTLPDWVAARYAGGLHGAYLPGLRDTGVREMPS